MTSYIYFRGYQLNILRTVFFPHGCRPGITKHIIVTKWGTVSTWLTEPFLMTHPQTGHFSTTQNQINLPIINDVPFRLYISITHSLVHHYSRQIQNLQVNNQYSVSYGIYSNLRYCDRITIQNKATGFKKNEYLAQTKMIINKNQSYACLWFYIIASRFGSSNEYH